MDDARAEAASAVMRRHAQRVRLAAGRPANWMELMRYCCVGGSGYLINLGVFVLADPSMPYTLALHRRVHLRGDEQLPLEPAVDVRVEHGPPHHQYARFLGVSAAALVLDLIVLRVLVELAGRPEAAGGGHRDPRGAARELPWQQALDV